jgi:hypothetical protein
MKIYIIKCICAILNGNIKALKTFKMERRYCSDEGEPEVWTRHIRKNFNEFRICLRAYPPREQIDKVTEVYISQPPTGGCR